MEEGGKEKDGERIPEPKDNEKERKQKKVEKRKFISVSDGRSWRC